MCNHVCVFCRANDEILEVIRRGQSSALTLCQATILWEQAPDEKDVSIKGGGGGGGGLPFHTFSKQVGGKTCQLTILNTLTIAGGCSDNDEFALSYAAYTNFHLAPLSLS